MQSVTPIRKVEIVLDTACGWSYLGYTRFTRAASRYRTQGGEVEVTFRPFQLDPDAPTDGEPLVDVLRRKFGGEVEWENARFTALAARDGLEINYDLARHSNTFEAHRLIHVASDQKLAETMVERLFRAHFTDGLNVGDRETLDRLAREVGVTFHDSGATQVRAELANVRRSGVTGVPLFVFYGKPALSGAQSDDALFGALEDTTR